MTLVLNSEPFLVSKMSLTDSRLSLIPLKQIIFHSSYTSDNKNLFRTVGLSASNALFTNFKAKYKVDCISLWNGSMERLFPFNTFISIRFPLRFDSELQQLEKSYTIDE